MTKATRAPRPARPRNPNTVESVLEIVAAYLRVSTKEQAEGYGLEVQEDEVTGWCTRREAKIFHTYRDEGVSGALENRPDMKRLEAAAHQGSFTKIVVAKVDRVGRTARAALNWAWRMQDIGVDFVAVQEGIDTSSEMGWTMFQQYVFFSELEWNRIRERTQSGREKKISYGGWPGGPAPYGYRIEGIGRRGSYLVIHEDEARVIRKAVEFVLGGMNPSAACAALNLLGEKYYTRSGKPWTPSNLINRLKSETFDGYSTYRKTNRGWGKNATKQYDDGTPVYGESLQIAVPQILMPDELKAFRAAMNRTAFKNGRQADRVYPLSGRIHGSCGHTYAGAGRAAGTGSKDNPTGRSYRCKGNVTNGSTACTDVYFPAEPMEAAAWNELTKLLGDRERLMRMAKDWIESLPGDAHKYEERRAQMERQIADKKKQIDVQVPQYIAAGVDATVMQKAIKTMQDEVGTLETSLVEVNNWLDSYTKAKDQADAIVNVAMTAADDLTTMSLADKADLFEMFDLQVHPENHRIVGKGGIGCDVTRWHEATGTLVPADPTDEEWEEIRAMLLLEFGSVHFSRRADVRGIIVKCFERLRGGLSWTELAPVYQECQRYRERSLKWWQTGAWQSIVEICNRKGGGTPVYVRPVLPPLRITASLRGGLLAAMDKDGLREPSEDPIASLPATVLSSPLTTGVESPI